MNHHLYFAGAGMALLAPLLASCEQKGPSKILQAEIVSALENVEDKASAVKPRSSSTRLTENTRRRR